MLLQVSRLVGLISNHVGASRRAVSAVQLQSRNEQPRACIARPGRSWSVPSRGFHSTVDISPETSDPLRQPVCDPSLVLADLSTHTSKHKLTIFTSTSSNPYHNLALETYLLRHSHPSSYVLFFYTNRPCVVFGRNQNPWVELSIRACKEAGLDIVRRRSGGGTVIHDAGNLNWCFIAPNDRSWNRDKHLRPIRDAIMSVKQQQNFTQFAAFEDIRLNERHDLVMLPKLVDEHRQEPERKEFKVSGSAYKLIGGSKGGRALHHGTILHSSPNLKQFGTWLSSPAKRFIEAKGVGSVRSPVRNLFDFSDLGENGLVMVRNMLSDSLIDAIILQTTRLYDVHEYIKALDIGDADCMAGLLNDHVYNDLQELQSDDWRYGQTPTFTYRLSGDLDKAVHPLWDVRLEVKKGQIVSAAAFDDGGSLVENSHWQSLRNKSLWNEAIDWKAYVPFQPEKSRAQTINHFQNIFPTI